MALATEWNEMTGWRLRSMASSDVLSPVSLTHEHPVAVIGVNQCLTVSSEVSVVFLEASVSDGVTLVVSQQTIAKTQLTPKGDTVNITAKERDALVGEEQAQFPFLDRIVDVFCGTHRVFLCAD